MARRSPTPPPPCRRCRGRLVDELRQALSFDDEAPAQAAPVIPYVPPMTSVFRAPRGRGVSPRHPLPSGRNTRLRP